MPAEASPSAPAVSVRDIHKTFGQTIAIDRVSLTVPAGEFLTVTGPSGCGKSTLLNLIAGLETPTSGTVSVAGEELSALSDDERTDLRLRHIAMIFQSFNLFPALSVAENVGLPLELTGLSGRTVKRRAAAMLEQVGVATTHFRRRPAELSGGEQQRVAIARALVDRAQASPCR